LKQTDHSALSLKPLANGAGHTFFEQAALEGEIGDDLLQRLRPAAEILHLVGSRGARSVAGKPPFTGRSPSRTTRIFSSAEKCRRVARRMSLIASSAG
jgi:hypothetical protein